MNKVEITNPFVGIAAMQVCCEKDATNQEILEVCNSQNPSGTSNGWTVVGRDLETCYGHETALPGPCAEFEGRIHLIVFC